MKRAMFGIVAASVMVWGVGACISGPIVPTTSCATYAGASYWHKKEPAQATVCLDEGEGSADLEFKDSSGTPLPGGGHVSAGGCITVPIPPDAASWDWVQSPQPSDPVNELSIASLTPWVKPVVFVHAGEQEYVVGCKPLKASPGEVARSYAFKVKAASAAEAKSKVMSLVYHGPGTVLPPGVKVGEYIEAELVGSDVVIRSSLVDRFVDYKLYVNGDPVADLASSLNVEFASQGNGWLTISSTVPVASLPVNISFSLYQQARHDPDAVYATLSF